MFLMISEYSRVSDHNNREAGEYSEDLRPGTICVSYDF